MSVLFIALPVALIIAAIAVAAFVWAARSGQFDDLDTPALRMLHDDERPRGTPPAGSNAPGRDRAEPAE